MGFIEGEDVRFAKQITSRLREAGFVVKRYITKGTSSREDSNGVNINDLITIIDPGGETEDLEDLLPDLLLIDVDCRDLNSIQSLIGLERENSLLPYPVVALAGSPTTEGLLEAFAAGANDYVYKLAPLEEIIARIHNLTGLFQRIDPHEHQYIEHEDLRIEIKQHKVFRGGEEIPLTPKEFDLLLFMARRKKKVCSRELLLHEVWGYDFTGKTNVVDVYIKHIRSKIDKGRKPKLLHTVRGTGYMLQ
ncbi:response regulator transcription factor [Paenibacillus physcomitrellae]|uniref:DNA-binding response regulator n=1 Tax=Paenibacillus physcomitrellae TaxID=1619311 RepID=A0ABQ1FQN5_9BACL|nr:response regulator transcription factor [Paenibacillus physcomitrellae]GGA25034.1 hypothetical protein GCM10010917_07430 [Paenibacillus physcomitrellae]